jgi:hypothetical protein
MYVFVYIFRMHISMCEEWLACRPVFKARMIQSDDKPVFLIKHFSLCKYLNVEM